jgi:CPA1 family monovalent cation:H+ antiporter
VDGLSGYSVSMLGGYALVVTGMVVGTRLLWFFTVPYLIRVLDRRPAQRARRVGARWRLVIAWSGMRGAVSLAVALALPLTTNVGRGFPKRDLIVFLTFAVIFFTLVVQGLSLPALIRRLGVSDGGAEADEEVRARLVATRAALEQIDALAGEEWTRDDTIERLRRFYEFRKRRFAAAPARSRTRGTRTARSPTSKRCSSCWGRSARRSCGCGTMGSSRTRR